MEKPVKAAAYARFSSDRQRQASITDQLRICRTFAEDRGWRLIRSFKDTAVSGSSSDRKEYQEMQLWAAEGRFTVLLVEDLSRLSRDEIEMKQLIRRFAYRNIRIVGVSDGFDSASKGYKLHAGMRGIINEIYIDDLREKTHRGLTGQALKQFNCGGRSYGYHHVPIEDPQHLDQFGRPTVTAVKREVNEEQATWVRWIFERYAEGQSPRWIAGELNRLGVRSPRNSTWASSAISGQAAKGTGILNNPLYVGKYIWNRSKWVLDPDTRKRRRIERPPEEWIENDLPHIQIVSTELWERVRSRQAEQQARAVKIREALHDRARTGARPKYLLSGLLKCGTCGRNFVICSSNHYGCSTYIYRGQAACSNSTKVRKTVVERALLTDIKENLLKDEAVEVFLGEFRRAVRARSRKSRPRRPRIQEEVSVFEKQIENLLAAIKAGVVTPSTKRELLKLERAKDDLGKQLERANEPMPNIEKLLPHAVTRFKELVADLENLPPPDICRARTYIGELLGGEIRLVKTAEGHLEAELRGDLTGLARLTAGPKISGVAGGGFEPPTFGL